MEVRTKARRWGSSIAVILPKAFVDDRRINENDEIIIEVKKHLLVKDVFGMLKGRIKRPTQEIKDEMRRGWLSASDREREKEWKMQKK